MYNIPITLKLVKKVITELHSSNVPGLDYTPPVIPMNCESEILYILAECFNMCLKRLCFPNC